MTDNELNQAVLEKLDIARKALGKAEMELRQENVPQCLHIEFDIHQAIKKIDGRK